jgi:hypothetical protein
MSVHGLHDRRGFSLLVDHAIRARFRRAVGFGGGALLARARRAALAVAPLLRAASPGAPGVTSAPSRTTSLAPARHRGEATHDHERRQTLQAVRAALPAAAPVPGSPAADVPVRVAVAHAPGAAPAAALTSSRHVAAPAPGLPERRGPPDGEVVLAVHVHIHPRPA